MAKTTDEAVMQLLIKVQQKTEEIKKAKKRPQWKTNCTLGFDPESPQGRVNIMTVRDASKVVDLYAFLIQREEFFKQAAHELGLEVDLVYMGYSFDDWKVDLMSRAAQLSVEQKKKEVEALDRRVNKLVSPDQRREMELEALQKILG